MKEFAENILKTLKSNGYPEKRVSLPTDKMFEVAEAKGFSFNDVLQTLKTEHNVEAKIGAEKIIFSVGEVLSTKSPEEMMKQAQEMMSKMDPEELRKMKEMFANMTDEEKKEIFKKGKDLGII